MLTRISLYINWVKTWKSLPVFHWVKANNYYKEKRYDLARHYYKAGLDRHPEHVASYAARLDLAYCLFKLRKFDDAQEQLRALINAMPSFREAHIRLARIQAWMGHTLDAAWTLRRAIQQFKPDTELVALFLYNIVEHEGTSYLITEGLKYAEELRNDKASNSFLETAFAKLEIQRGNRVEAKEKLLQICAQVKCPFEAVLLLSELYLHDNEIEKSRYELKQLMKRVSDHPRVLSLLAETYLKSGEFYNPEYANQLAVSACQNSQWSSPRELHILAESYYHQGDKISALILASKAKQTGSQLLGSYREIKSLDKLIETLSSSTLA
jgi:predicted Zn-dependent protease